MKPQILHLMPNTTDEKRWVAEITGEDPTFKLKRDFQPDGPEGVWEIYDGWYQIHGQATGVSPFNKEYVHVKNGRMLRHLNFRYVLAHLEDIKAAEPERMERMRKQIYVMLDEIKREAPYQPVEEAMERQKEDCNMTDEPDQLLGAIAILKKRKNAMIKEYHKTFENYQEW
ncbi:hypothetical protein [Jeotgalibaca porci]|uniref:hypothetical protein n=1 Tax=Jeotgalibaca porci TaxID=1868793 RepID=UPI0035A12076